MTDKIRTGVARITRLAYMNKQKNKIKTSIKVGGWVGGWVGNKHYKGLWNIFRKKLKNTTPLNLNIDLSRGANLVSRTQPSVKFTKRGVPQMV